MLPDSGDEASRYAAERPDRRDGTGLSPPRSLSAHFDCTEMLSVALAAAERLGRDAMVRWVSECDGASSGQELGACAGANACLLGELARDTGRLCDWASGAVFGREFDDAGGCAWQGVMSGRVQVWVVSAGPRAPRRTAPIHLNLGRRFLGFCAPATDLCGDAPRPRWQRLSLKYRARALQGRNSLTGFSVRNAPIDNLKKNRDLHGQWRRCSAIAQSGPTAPKSLTWLRGGHPHSLQGQDLSLRHWEIALADLRSLAAH